MAMAGKAQINSVENDQHNARTSMMDMWKESVQRAKANTQTTVKAAKDEREARAELEQRIRNGQAECPTCASRTFKDQSSDGGVSFQAAQSIPMATAGVTVAAHEGEHVSANAAQPGEETVTDSSVTLQHGKCPDCGRTYVAGGVTKTTTRPASYTNQSRYAGFGGMDIRV
jgi:transposase-like protein